MEAPWNRLHDRILESGNRIPRFSTRTWALIGVWTMPFRWKNDQILQVTQSGNVDCTKKETQTVGIMQNDILDFTGKLGDRRECALA